jgi:hypothetical protein
MTDLVTSGVYLAPTASSLGSLSGTRRASRNGKRRRRLGCVVSRRSNRRRQLSRQREAVEKGEAC